MLGEGQGSIMEKGLQQSIMDTEQAPHGSGYGPSAGVLRVFGQHSQTQGLDFGWWCVEPGV